MSSEVLSSDDVEAADFVWGLQHLAPAAECLNLRRRLMHLQWGYTKKKSTRPFRGKWIGNREKISPSTPQNNLIQSLSDRSAEEAKGKNSLLKDMQAEVAMKQQEQEQPDQQHQRRWRPALDLNRSPPVEEAIFASRQQKMLCTMARKKRMSLMKAMRSSQKLAVKRMD